MLWCFRLRCRCDDLLVCFRCVVFAHGWFGFVDVDRGRNRGAIDGVRKHEDQRQGQPDEGSQKVGILSQRFLHRPNPREAVQEGLYCGGCRGSAQVP